MKYAAAYGLALLIFLVMDALWLGVVARNFYFTRMADILLDQPRWGVAAAFYAFYVVGVVYFAVAPGMAAGSWSVAAFNGALFGGFAYLTYNATNLSVMRGYDPLIALVDTSWGAVVTAVTAGGAVAALGWLGMLDA
jgi:uncharacterized membrane protein